MKVQGNQKPKNEPQPPTVVYKNVRPAIVTKGFWDRVFCKIVETLTSVKVWVLFATFAFCACGLWWGLLVGDNVATILVGVITPVVVMREGFKISKIWGTAKAIMGINGNPETNKIVKETVDRFSNREK